MRQRTLRGVLLAAGCALLPSLGHAADYLDDARRLLRNGDVRAAEIQLRNAVRSDPHSAEAHYELARVSLELGEAAAAEREARAARDRGYDPRAVTPVLARAYMAQGKYREVLSEFTSGGKDPLADADVLVIRGYAQSALGKPDDAQASFAEARRLAPNATRPLVAIARIAAGRRDFAEALKDADAALALEPKSPEILVLKSQLLRARGDAAGAMQAANDAIAAAPDAMAARLERASLSIAAGQSQAARQDVDFVLAATPNSVQALYLRAVLLAEARDFKAADAVLARIAPAMDGIPRGYFLQALVKRELRQTEQAEDAASRYVTRVPADLQGAKLLASLQIQKHEADAAIATLTQATASGRADRQTYELLGQAYTQAGRRDEAVQSLEHAASLAPGDAGTRTRLAAARMGAGETEAAIADLEASLAMAPDQQAIGPALFFAELSTGDLGRAASALARVRAAEGDTPAVRNLEGLLRLAELDPGRARTVFEGILKDNPGFTPARINLARLDVMQGHPDAAEKLTADILAKEPLSEPAFSMNQALLLGQGRVAEAMAALERARAAAPADPRPTIALAGLYQKSGDTKRALDLLSPPPGAVAGQPLPLLAARAQLLAATGKTAEARDALRDLLARDPAALEPRLRLIAASVQARDYEAARTLVQEGLRLSPRNYQLLSAYPAIDLQASGLDAALATADRLARQNQDFALARALRGDVYMQARKYEDAAKAYAAAGAAAPTQALALRESGAWAEAGHPERAADALRLWLGAHAQDVAAMRALASFEIAESQFGEAAALLQKAVAQGPRDAIALNNLAWLYAKTGDARARATAQKAYVLLPNAETADTLGWILVSGGDTERGVMLLRQAHALNAADPTVTYHFAVALGKAGQRGEAVGLLAPLVSGNRDFAEKAGAERLLHELSKG